jgi:formylglycine-generating enzyme required for sulfatase activity
MGARREAALANLDVVVLKALEPDRARRYESGAELLADWDRARRGLLPLARRASRLRRLAFSVRRRPQAVWNTLAVILLVGLAAAAVRLYFFPRAPAVPPIQTSNPDEPRLVRLDTNPLGARAAIVPLDPDSGLPHPESLVAVALPQMPILLSPGDYLIEVEWPDGRFHQVYRHVPRPKGVGAGSFRHHRWVESPDGVIQVPRIDVPPADAEAGMVRFNGVESYHPSDVSPGMTRVASGKVDDFLLDPTEVTVAQFRQVELVLPPELAKRPPAPTDAVCFVSFDFALDYAERTGKRLPDELEYLFAATANGTRKYPWGDSKSPISDHSWSFGPVGADSFDVTATDRPVFGLFSNVAEWTTTWITGDPSVNPELLPGDFRDGRIVAGGPPSVVNGVPDADEALIGPRFRHAMPHYRTARGLGFRCARSLRPKYLKPAHASQRREKSSSAKTVVLADH